MFTEGGQPLFPMFYRGGGKGGKSAPPPPPTYTDPQSGMTFQDPNAMNAEITQRNQQAAADKAAADAAAAAQAQQQEQTFQGNRQQAYNDAMQNVMQTFQGQGVDPNKYMSYIQPQLQSAMNSVPDLSTNIASYFPSSLGQQILNQATGDRRTQLMNQLNQTFTPQYSSGALPTSIMDPAINTMLSNQFDPLSSQLTNAMKRGTLTDVGYKAAVDKMNQDRSAAQSQLQTLGQNILTGDRGALDTLASGARSDIAGSSLGQNIDPTSYVNQANQLTQQDISGFGGALQNAAGNVTYGDIQDLLNAGGAVQGATNPTAANPMGAGGGTGAIGAGGPGVGTSTTPGMPGQDDTTKRGLGSTGAF